MVSGAFFLSACIPKPQMIAHDSACAENEKEYQANLQNLEQEIAIKNQKLSELGLLDRKNQLKQTKQITEEVKGTESWLK